MSNHSHAAKRLAWVERLERFEHVGQTVAQFCDAEGVSPASFYQWRRKLRGGSEAVTQDQPRFIPVKLPPNHPAPPTTVVSLELPGGVRVRLEVSDAEGTQR